MFDILKKLIGKKRTPSKDPLDKFRKEESKTPPNRPKTSQNKKKHRDKKGGAPPVSKISPPKTIKKSAHPPKKNKKREHRLNKHGLPVLKKDSDLSALFREEKSLPSTPPPPVQKKPGKAVQKQKKKKQPPKNRHGIPIFSKQTDFSVFFSDGADAPPPLYKGGKSGNRPEEIPDEENFEKLLEESLAGKTAEAMLQEKADAVPDDRPPTRQEKLRAYPPPQDELDLHGFTAQEAIDRAENFIRTARQRGKRTLLIIVGKGTHSRHKAVLPDVVETKIIELKRKNIVMTFEWEKGRKHKSGAIIVYLTPMSSC